MFHFNILVFYEVLKRWVGTRITRACILHAAHSCKIYHKLKINPSFWLYFTFLSHFILTSLRATWLYLRTLLYFSTCMPGIEQIYAQLMFVEYINYEYISFFLLERIISYILEILIFSWKWECISLFAYYLQINMIKNNFYNGNCGSCCYFCFNSGS